MIEFRVRDLPLRDDDDMLVVVGSGPCWVVTLSLDRPREGCRGRRDGISEEDDESDDTGLGPFKFCVGLDLLRRDEAEEDPLPGGGSRAADADRVRDKLFLLAIVGRDSDFLVAVPFGGGARGAHEASESMGCFIQVATV